VTSGDPKGGENWRYSGQAAGSFYQQAVDADLAIVPDAGHEMFVENPETSGQ
jgi:hypothetical protein